MSDFTYVPSCEGTVYVLFLQDAFSRRILGFTVATSAAGSQLTGSAFSQKLLNHGMAGSIGRVGTAHDKALMESTIGLYKAELIRASGRAWASRQEIETATTAWVAWFNERCLHSRLGYLSPVKYEAAYNQNLDLPRQAA